MDLTAAFQAGKRQFEAGQTHTVGRETSIGNPVGTVSEYDPTTSPDIATAASSLDVVGRRLKPGQRLGHHGTTVFNPKRNDPEVEAVLGLDTYKQKISGNSPDALRLEQLELKNLIAAQQAQISMLTQIIAGGGGGGGQPGTVTHPVATAAGPPPIITTNVPEGTPIKVIDMNDYRVIAKASGIKTFGRKKDEVIAELKDKGLM